MNPNLIKLLALLGQGAMVAGGVGMLADKDMQPAEKRYDSYEDYLRDEEVPLEERMARVEQRQRDKYENSPAHKAKLEALKKLQGK
jgi:hypothetical protein